MKPVMRETLVWSWGEGQRGGIFCYLCFNIQFFYWVAPVHFILKLLICPFQRGLSRFWLALAACLSGLSPSLFDCCWASTTFQHIIYTANDADHSVTLCILMAEFHPIPTLQHLGSECNNDNTKVCVLWMHASLSDTWSSDISDLCSVLLGTSAKSEQDPLLPPAQP